MSENKKAEPKSVSRRDFLKDAGIVLGGAAAGSALLLTGCREEKEITKTKTISAFVCPACQAEFDSLATLQSHFEKDHDETRFLLTKTSYIEVDPELCRGCHRCQLACSLYHTGECSVEEAGLCIDVDNFNMEFSGYSCAQCVSPSCYQACPLKDLALCIDEVTGVRYVDQDKCNGCGECVPACPFEIPRITIDMTTPIATRRAFKCDLCRDRPDGPICIETCSRNAIKLVTREV
jgi:Fe-S-cluster-containing hydrogenase component 2